MNTPPPNSSGRPPASLLFRPNSVAAQYTLDSEAVVTAETTLKIRLPEAYLDLLREQNGGYLRLNGIWSKEQPAPHHTDRRIYDFEQIAGIRTVETDIMDLIQMSSAAHNGWDLPRELIPFDGDGHWWLCLDYRQCGPDGQPCITHYEPDELLEDNPVSFRVADSFANLLSGLFFDSAVDLFAIDPASMERDDIYRTLSSLGATPCKEHRPRWWWRWPKYRGSESHFDDECQCFLAVFPNGSANNPTCPHAPGSSLMLHVGVDDTDRPMCLTELTTAFASKARLVHQPADGPQLRLDPVSGKFVSVG